MQQPVEDLERGVAFVQKLVEEYEHLRSQMPEDLLPINMSRGSEEHLRFLTFVATIDYLKNADLLWAGARKALQEEPWLFDPKAVASETPEKVGATLRRFGMARMSNKDGFNWWRVAKTFATIYDGKISNLLAAAEFDAVKLYYIVSGFSSSLMPYLRGPKILPFWIRIVAEEARIQLSNMDKIPLPADINVIKATFMLGVLRGKVKGGNAIREELKHTCIAVWRKVAERSNIPLIRFDEPLWLLGRENPLVMKLAEPFLLTGYQGKIKIGYDSVSIDT